MVDPEVVTKLSAALSALAPWSYERDFSAADWRRYVDAALLVQGAEQADVDRALASFLDQGAGFTAMENETRVFLLLRVVFDLPERAPVGARKSFKGWVNWPEPDDEGTVNLSWPVGMRSGRPVLLARFEGAEGPRYAAGLEYRHALAMYPYRDLRQLSGETGSNSSSRLS